MMQIDEEQKPEQFAQHTQSFKWGIYDWLIES